MTEFLKNQNLSNLAEEMGVERSILSKIRSGKRTPAYSTVIKIIEHLKKQNYTDTEILNIILSK